MALLSRRKVLAAAAPLMVAASMLCSSGAIAATDPCKTNAKSAACKAARSGTKIPTTVSKTKTVSKAAAKTRVATRKKTIIKATTKSSSHRPTQAVRQTTVIARQVPAAADAPERLATPSSQAAALRSSVAYVQDLETSTVLFSKNENTIRPIASISKLMTALVVVDANQPMDEMLEIDDDDIDRLRHAASRLPVGTELSRADMLHLALMSSENRAAHALGRYYPGGMPAFVRAMNAKARELGMMDTHFVEPTGLSSENVSSPRDLVRLLRAAGQRPLIHRYTTDTEYDVDLGKGRTRRFGNTNALVRKSEWDIKVSKTGFINEAGECLVMLVRVDGRDLAIVLLDSQGKYSRFADAIRIRKFVQNEVAML